MTAPFDRRLIYVLIVLCATVPLFTPLGLPVTVSQPAQHVYDFIEKLPPRSLVWMGFDYYLSTRAEVEPGAEAAARHLFRRGCRIVATSLIPDSAVLSQRVLHALAREQGKQYGSDYAILGYKAGNQIVIKQICANVHAIFPTDVSGTAVDALPIMRSFRSYRDVTMVFTASDTNLFDYYAVFANSQYGLPVAGCSTAVMVPILAPYVNAHQILGIVGGLKGAAEYEKLTGVVGLGTRGMDAQSVTHVFICALILLSNIIHFNQRKRRNS